MQSSMYHAAKLEKLKQLKKLMYELLGKDMGQQVMGEISSGDPMEETIEGDMPSVKDGMHAAEKEMADDKALADVKSVDDSAGEEMSELDKMKHDYFKSKFSPKPLPKRPGTAVMIATAEKIAPKAPMAHKKGKWK